MGWRILPNFNSKIVALFNRLNELCSNSFRDVFVLLVIVLALFAASLPTRLPYIGSVGEPVPNQSVNPEINSALSAHAVNEWIEKDLPLYALVVSCYPETMDRATVGMRIREMAYFSLTWLPLYFYSYFSGNLIDISHVQILSLLCQFMVVLGLSLTSYTVTRPAIGSSAAISLAALTCLFATFLPGARYLFLYCYFPDVAVLPLVAWLLYFEALRDDARLNQKSATLKQLELFVGFFIFTAALTEWLAYLIAGAIGLKRVMLDNSVRSWSMAISTFSKPLIPVAAAALVFSIWVTVNTGWLEVAARFLIHTGIADGNVDESHIWVTFFGNYYIWIMGSIAAHCQWFIGAFTIFGMASILRSRLRGKLPNPLLLRATPPIFVLLLGILADVFLLTDHHVENPHTALKFVLPFSLGIPIVFYTVGTWLAKPIRRVYFGGGLQYHALALALPWIISISLLLLNTSVYDDHIHMGTSRYRDYAERLDPPLMRPEMLFATFAHGDADIFIGPLYYKRQIYPFVHMEYLLPVLARQRGPMDDTLGWIVVLEIGRLLGICPPFLHPLPDRFDVGFVHWREESLPEEYATVAGYATEVIDTENAKLYILDQDAVVEYWYSLQKPGTEGIEPVLELPN